MGLLPALNVSCSEENEAHTEQSHLPSLEVTSSLIHGHYEQQHTLFTDYKHDIFKIP